MERGELAPGHILVRNVNVGIDPTNPQFQVLYSEELDREVRCFRRFKFPSIVNKVFSLDEDGAQGLFFPVVIESTCGNSYLLAPPFTDHISPGMVIADLVFLENLVGKLNFSKVNLRYSKTFSDEDPQSPTNYELRYRCAVHEPLKSNVSLPCQAVVHKLTRKKPEFRHIDATFLRNHHGELFTQNLSQLESAFEDGENMWWSREEEISQEEFEEVTEQPSPARKRKAINAQYYPEGYNFNLVR